MKRIVDGIAYELTVKQVKNINLRVKKDGTVAVSAGRLVPFQVIDSFVIKNKQKIFAWQKNKPDKEELNVSDCDALALFSEISDEIYPLFSKYCKEKPTIKVKLMNSCWGICHYTKGYISLNKALYSKPRKAIEYVIMHEYVHFIEHNHQSGFHRIMSKLMPDYKERKKLLNSR